MSAYIVILAFSFASFYFVTCQMPFPMSVDRVIYEKHVLHTYETSQFTRLCNYGDQSNNSVKSLCLRLEITISETEERGRIQTESGCEETQLRFTTSPYEIAREEARIGICRRGSYGENGICVSASVNKGDLLVWIRHPYTMLNTATGEAEEESRASSRLPPQDNTGASSSSTGPMRSASRGRGSTARQAAEPYTRRD